MLAPAKLPTPCIIDDESVDRGDVHGPSVECRAVGDDMLLSWSPAAFLQCGDRKLRPGERKPVGRSPVDLAGDPAFIPVLIVDVDTLTRFSSSLASESLQAAHAVVRSMGESCRGLVQERGGRVDGTQGGGACNGAGTDGRMIQPCLFVTPVPRVGA